MDQSLAQRVGPVLIYLMRGVLYRDQHEDQWQILVQHQAPIVDYLRIIGLELELDQAEGFAFLRQRASDSDEDGDGNGDEAALPRLIQRRSLSYPVSLLCVLLRKQLVESDSDGDQQRLIITREQVVEMLRVFLPEQSNEARIIEQIDAHINKVIELGLLRSLKSQPDTYEVRRIIKALVDADWLADLKTKLEEYRSHAEPA